MLFTTDAELYVRASQRMREAVREAREAGLSGLIARPARRRRPALTRGLAALAARIPPCCQAFAAECC